jgi:hypothetical protein
VIANISKYRTEFSEAKKIIEIYKGKGGFRNRNA